MKSLILYHGDCLDGFTAAWAHRYFHDGGEYVPVRYGEPCPVEIDGRHVYILDFSYPRESLLAMRDRAASLVVIDHHKTAQADLAGLDFCVFDMERSGAGLTWDHFAARGMEQHFKRPWLIDYVEDRDLWRFALPRSREVNAYLRSQPQTFETWDAMNAIAAEEAMQLGQGCQAHIEAYVRAAVRHAYLAKLGEGTTLPLVNVTYESCSEVADELVRSTGSDVAGYYFERGDGRIQYGLRSRSGFDCSAIARAFGGGGHAGASGFVTNDRVHVRVGPLPTHP